MKMFVALASGLLLSSAAFAQHAVGASTGGGNETPAETSEPAANSGSAAPATENSNAQAETEEAGERRICRNIANTETRLSRTRVCMTAAQWRRHGRGN
jgi:hypothetical protein